MGAENHAEAELWWSVAVHEAGHGIVALELGLKMKRLEIIDHEGKGCSCIETPTDIIDEIALRAAGIEAAELLDAGCHELAGFSDEAKIFELLDKYPETEHDNIRGQGRQRARKILEKHQNCLGVIAKALASKGRLDGNSVAMLWRRK
jgi:hypothetical protein